MSDEPIQLTEATGTDPRRIKLLLLAAAVAVAVALVVPRLLGGGGDGGDELGSSVTPVVPPAPSGAPTAPGGGEVPEVVQSFSTRNPFTPLLASSTGGAAAPAPAAPAPEPIPVVEPVPVYEIPEDPVVVFPTEPAPSWPVPTTPPTTAPPAPAPTESRFALVEVTQDAAGQVLSRVRVNDVLYEVVVGHDFADRYRFVSADLVTRCGSFLFGDKRFELCEGEETRT